MISEESLEIRKKSILFYKNDIERLSSLIKTRNTPLRLKNLKQAIRRYEIELNSLLDMLMEEVNSQEFLTYQYEYQEQLFGLVDKVRKLVKN